MKNSFCSVNRGIIERSASATACNQPDTILVPPADESKLSDWNLFFAQCHKIEIGLYIIWLGRLFGIDAEADVRMALR